MKLSSLFLLLFTLLLSPAYADDVIKQDVSRLFEGMDTSALNNPAQNGTGSTSNNTATTTDNGILMRFEFEYGAKAGIYGPMQFNMNKRSIKKLKRKLAHDEKKLDRSGNMSLKVFVRIALNKQVINKFENISNHNDGHGHIVYFDVAEFYQQANSDPEFNKQLLAAASRSIGNSALKRAVETGDYSAISNSTSSRANDSIKSGVKSAINSSIQHTINSSIQHSVNSAVQDAVNEGSNAVKHIIMGGGGSGGGGMI